MLDLNSVKNASLVNMPILILPMCVSLALPEHLASKVILVVMGAVRLVPMGSLEGLSVLSVHLDITRKRELAVVNCALEGSTVVRELAFAKGVRSGSNQEAVLNLVYRVKLDFLPKKGRALVLFVQEDLFRMVIKARVLTANQVVTPVLVIIIATFVFRVHTLLLAQALVAPVMRVRWRPMAVDLAIVVSVELGVMMKGPTVNLAVEGPTQAKVVVAVLYATAGNSVIRRHLQ